MLATSASQFIDWKNVPPIPGAALTFDSSSVPRKAATSKRVLIVEDNLDAVRTSSMLLAEMGHQVEYAINGYVALSIAERFKPDVILLDLGLPGLDGIEVCSRIKKDPELMHARVFVITGYAQKEFVVRAKQAGCELYLMKPVSTGVLEELLS